MKMDLEALKNQMMVLKEVVKVMSPEEKTIFAKFWLAMYKDLFGV